MDKKLFMNHVSTLFFRTSSKEIKPGTRFKQLREWNILLAVSFVEMFTLSTTGYIGFIMNFLSSAFVSLCMQQAIKNC